jgi:hypothetical protein
MSKGLQKQRKITTSDAVKSLHENGIEVSEKDAEVILYFLFILAKLIVNEYFNEDQNLKF